MCSLDICGQEIRCLANYTVNSKTPQSPTVSFTSSVGKGSDGIPATSLLQQLQFDTSACCISGLFRVRSAHARRDIPGFVQLATKHMEVLVARNTVSAVVSISSGRAPVKPAGQQEYANELMTQKSLGIALNGSGNLAYLGCR